MFFRKCKRKPEKNGKNKLKRRRCHVKNETYGEEIGKARFVGEKGGGVSPDKRAFALTDMTIVYL